jgi:hypothetical protein
MPGSFLGVCRPNEALLPAYNAYANTGFQVCKICFGAWSVGLVEVNNEAVEVYNDFFLIWNTCECKIQIKIWLNCS